MKKIIFLCACMIMLVGHHTFGQAIGTWVYDVQCTNNEAICETYHNRVVIVIDTLNIAVLISKDAVVRERFILSSLNGTLYYLQDSLGIGYYTSLDTINTLPDSISDFELQDTYPAVFMNQTCTVVETAINSEGQLITQSFWVDSNATEISDSFSIPYGIIPVINAVNRTMPLKMVLTTQNLSENVGLEYILASYSPTPSYSLLEIADDIEIKAYSPSTY